MKVRASDEQPPKKNRFVIIEAAKQAKAGRTREDPRRSGEPTPQSRPVQALPVPDFLDEFSCFA